MDDDRGEDETRGDLELRGQVAQARKEDRRRRRLTLGAGTFLPAILSPAARKRGFAEASILTDWAGIVGEGIARLCQPTALRFARGARGGGVLELRVTSAAALEIQHSAPVLIERINTHLGHQAVARLKLVRAPFQRPARRAQLNVKTLDAQTQSDLERAVEPIENEALREALLSLGRAIHQRG